MRAHLMMTGLSSATAFSLRAGRSLNARGGANMSTAADAAPGKIAVYYGNLPFWRAECVRMALHIGGIEFEDVRDWAAGKQMRTFGSLPIMTVDGKVLSQTQAMATYAGKLGGLYPTDPWAAAKCDELINGCTDVTSVVSATMRIKDETLKKEARADLVGPDGKLTVYLNGIDRILSENHDASLFAVGAELTVADLAIWRLAGWLDGGKLDGLPAGYTARTFPRIAALLRAVDAHPGVASWKALHPDFYKT
ncbi:hypothetical protein M885DRAFT_528321 [Pelagophyceae sp. CCMP2097]|nr:hypothetical protein M885DRAFT_528321 [Pelagophyceae sp. CCMP2097]